MTFTKKTFSKRQIKKVEKAKEKLLKNINMFESGIRFVEEHYCITPKKSEDAEYSTQWLEDMKSAINNIDLENEEIAGKKVENGKYAILIQDYLIDIDKPILKTFYRVDGPIKEMLLEYQRRIIRILA